MTLEKAFENDEFNIALNEYDFPKAFSFLKKSEKEREKLYLALQEEGYNPLTRFTYIQDYFLKNASNIKYIIIPDSITAIGNDAFYDCINLKNIYIADIESWCNISFGNFFANPMQYGKNLYLNNEPVTELIIPNTVTKIKNYAFSGFHGLTKVVISDNVISIGDYAFYNCHSLTSVTIPDNVTSIGWYAFAGCTNLSSITIPDSVTTIGLSAFRYCNSLTNIKFNGTLEKWYRIKKQGPWNSDTPLMKIICTDGVINLK